MLTALVVALRTLARCCQGQQAIALENLALLRQQLAVFKRTAKRPSLRSRDRLFWMLLAHTWRQWRTALTATVADLANLPHESCRRLSSVDFFTVPTITGRLLFVFVVLRHHRRQIVHFNVSDSLWEARAEIWPRSSFGEGQLVRSRVRRFGSDVSGG